MTRSGHRRDQRHELARCSLEQVLQSRSIFSGTDWRAAAAKPWRSKNSGAWVTAKTRAILRRRASCRADAVRRRRVLAAIFGIDGKGANFREIGAVRLRANAAEDAAIFFLDEEMASMGADFFGVAGEQQALLRVVRDERVNRRRVGLSRDAFSWILLELARRLRNLQASATAPGAVPPRRRDAPGDPA